MAVAVLHSYGTLDNKKEMSLSLTKHHQSSSLVFQLDVTRKW